MGRREDEEDRAAAGSRTLGFLFADLRGFTEYVDRHGADASRHLLTRYRDVVRAVVDGHRGSEIRTEGDSFYVVFPSASEAVRAGIELRDACSAPPEGPPIAVGIGIHAGEAVPLEDNYVGSAVNIAARLCALAGPGDLLASGTVRELTRSVVVASWRPLGQRALKGIPDRVSVFRLAPSGSSGRDGLRVGVGVGAGRWPLVGLLASGAVVATAGLVLLLGQPGQQSGAQTPTPTATPGLTLVATATLAADPTPRPLQMSDGLAPHVTAPPGRYTTNAFEPALVFTLSTGWEATVDAPDALDLRRQTQARGPADGVVTFARVRLVYDRPCPTAPTSIVGSTPADLITWISTRPYLEVSQPEAITAAGLSGIRVTAVPKDSDGPTCPKRPSRYPVGYYLFPQGDSPFLVLPDEVFRVAVFDLPSGAPLTIIVVARPELIDAVDHEVDALLLTTSLAPR